MSEASRRGLTTIGLLVRRVDLNNYDKELWKLTYDRARSRNGNLLLVAGQSSFNFDPADFAYSAIYPMLSSRLVDGCLLSQTLALWMSAEEISRFSKELPALPLISASIKYGEHPCVLVDNAPGLRDLMRHLIQVHRCRRIVHVRGPHPNREAELREQVWREELLLAGITPEPQWLVQGHYSERELIGIGDKVLGQTQGQFDAVVACNDTAALRVIEDLQKQGYRVPEDYRVCGFDDNEGSQFTSPPLTTIRQPMEALSDACWAGLEAFLTGNRPPDRWVGTTLVVRQSCGCEAPLPERQDPTTLAAAHYKTVATLLTKVKDSSEFDQAMNQVTNVEELKTALVEWLPRIGIERFAVLRCCTSQGAPTAVVSQRLPGRPIGTGPQAFQVLVTEPEVETDSKTVIAASELALDPWFHAIEPFVVGTFPLVVGDVWYGLAFLELSRDAGVWERSVQEQVASVFHRLALERQNLEEKSRSRAKSQQLEAQDRLVSEVAHEINTPLGAIVSSSGVLESGLRDLVERSAQFFSSLSAEGRVVYARLAEYSSRGGPDLAGREERVRRASLSRFLAGIGCADPTVAEELVSLGWDGGDDELAAMARLPDFATIVHYLNSLEDLATSSRVIAAAADKVSSFVARLVVATQAEINNREDR